MGHAHRFLIVVRVGRMHVGFELTKHRQHRLGDPWHVAHPARLGLCTVARLVHHLVLAQNDCPCGHVNPREVADRNDPSPALNLHLPNRVRVPHRLALLRCLNRKPSHAQILVVEVAEVSGAHILAFPHRHVGLQHLKHCCLRQGRIGWDRLEVGPPIGAHHHEAVASEFGLKLGPQHGQALKLLGGKHAVVLAAPCRAYVSQVVAVESKTAQRPIPGRQSFRLGRISSQDLPGAEHAGGHDAVLMGLHPPPCLRSRSLVPH